jgi:hypothetical protein
MWIILNDAFLSVVALPDRPDSLLVRARFPDDIEAVFPGAKVEVSETRDYRFRSVIDRAVVGAAIAQRVDEVTYPNFKSSVSEDWRHALYLSVWSLFQREQQRRAKPMARAEPGFEFTFEAGDVDEAQPLIYHWKITNSAGEVLFQYVGKAKHGSRRPTRHYRRNVDRLLNGHPYRKGAPDAFREVHHELAAASRAGHTIVLRLLRNVRPGENINDAEREEQERYGCVTHFADGSARWIGKAEDIQMLGAYVGSVNLLSDEQQQINAENAETLKAIREELRKAFAEPSPPSGD